MLRRNELTFICSDVNVRRFLDTIFTEIHIQQMSTARSKYCNRFKINLNKIIIIFVKKIIFTCNAIFKTQKLAGGKNVKNGITQFLKT